MNPKHGPLQIAIIIKKKNKYLRQRRKLHIEGQIECEKPQDRKIYKQKSNVKKLTPVDNYIK